MTSETSAVTVAVRVRPFSAKEDPATCVLSIPDNTTITVSDVATQLYNALAGSDKAATGGTGGSGGMTGSAATTSSGSDANSKHSYTFDRIFWSVPPTVLPLLPSFLLESKDGDGPPIPVRPSAAAAASAASLPISQQMRLLGPSAASHLPCFGRVPTYEDQACVYGFIGPRMTKAVMSGFNACLFAYGQTGSGKSYSMVGPTDKLARKIAAEDQGVTLRLSEDLFLQMRTEREKDESVSYNVEVSFFEIYCEKVHDLLVNAAASAEGGHSSSHGGATSSSSSAAVGSSSAGGASSLRIRQHPTRGPYVEGLSHLKVRDAASVMKYLELGLRDRATAETKMNEHSSRSHAILQLHVTKVMVVTDDNGVLTKTRVSKVSMVDLAGSERVTQSGATGDRFEEAKNINLSLSTLGRVIQQLTEKQAGKHVIPAYRDSVLTWLLSDSLGGNSKTIMLATIAPSAYCYQQTLNTLRFAGVTKKVINVAIVNEDQHFQQLIAELRQQIVRLTLKVESGQASEVHMDEIRLLKAEREDLLAENDALRAKTVAVESPALSLALKKRVAELEEANAQLRSEKLSLQQRLLSSTTALREELARTRTEALTLQETLNVREKEWATRLKSCGPSVITAALRKRQGSSSFPDALAATAAAGAGDVGEEAVVSNKFHKEEMAKRDAEIHRYKGRIHQLVAEVETAKKAKDDIVDSSAVLEAEADNYKVRYEENKRQLGALHARMEQTLALLEMTQSQLAVTNCNSSAETARMSAMVEERESLLSLQRDETRQAYLEEKQSNVQLLLRVSQVEQERSQLRKQVAERRADVAELEQLLLEEAEASERCYTRMRYYRNLCEMQRQFTSRMVHASCDRRQSSPAIVPAANPIAMSTASVNMLFNTPRMMDASLTSTTPAVSPRALDTGIDTSPQQYSHDLFFAQLEYECLCEEAQYRAVVEREAAENMMRVLLCGVRLRREELVVVRERLTETTESLTLSEEEVKFLKNRTKELERAAQAAMERRVASEEAAQAADLERLRLGRKVQATEEAVASLEREKETLIGKLADLQGSYGLLQARCAQAERASAAAQEALMFGGVGGKGFEESITSFFPSETSQGVSRKASATVTPAHILQQEALASKDRELNQVRSELQRTSEHCQSLREEMAVLRAQLGRDATTRGELTTQAGRELAQLKQQHEAAMESNRQLTEELAGFGHDMDSRVLQQQEMIVTLRRSLEEETAMADTCRQAAQRAEAARHSLEEELAASREVCDDIRRGHRQLESQYFAVQKELDDLRSEYNALEKQLMELSEHEPQLWLMMEKEKSEDTSEWLDKARRERANLMKQKLEARRINAQLLEHVRSRNLHLRDVQRRHVSETPTAAGNWGFMTGCESGAYQHEQQMSTGYAGSSLPSSIHLSPGNEESQGYVQQL